MVLDVLGWAIVGLLAGLYASRMMGQSSYTGYGPTGDLGFGFLGALIGGVVARLLSLGGPAAGNTFTWQSLLLAAVSAFIFLGLARATSKQAAR